MGRPKKPIDARQVEELARYGCIDEEAATILGCSADTLTRRFADSIARGKALRKMDLRKAQTIRAIDHMSDRMLIHLGRTELGQTEGGGLGRLGDVLEEIAANGKDDPDPGAVPG